MKYEEGIIGRRRNVRERKKRRIYQAVRYSLAYPAYVIELLVVAMLSKFSLFWRLRSRLDLTLQLQGWWWTPSKQDIWHEAKLLLYLLYLMWTMPPFSGRLVVHFCPKVNLTRTTQQTMPILSQLHWFYNNADDRSFRMQGKRSYLLAFAPF